ncbi:hypothetical protein DFP72DRAFT_420358 [Ephemerocybe angulata]|uniref:Uncharacterized protein n=1 Tax=Ephemerocybe angulata TaxID=980116 RepID=A0A8H6IEW1_9AGAR|nr:hypothetical protein DFP72DRAFT_420358 [Tulosesus angulatus]
MAYYAPQTPQRGPQAPVTPQPGSSPGRTPVCPAVLPAAAEYIPATGTISTSTASAAAIPATIAIPAAAATSARIFPTTTTPTIPWICSEASLDLVPTTATDIRSIAYALPAGAATAATSLRTTEPVLSTAYTVWEWTSTTAATSIESTFGERVCSNKLICNSTDELHEPSARADADGRPKIQTPISCRRLPLCYPSRCKDEQPQPPPPVSPSALLAQQVQGTAEGISGTVIQPTPAVARCKCRYGSNHKHRQCSSSTATATPRPAHPTRANAVAPAATTASATATPTNSPPTNP